jgi:hypothetical protein
VLGGTRNLYLLTLPGDITFKSRQPPDQFYWDFAYNVTGDDRFDRVYAVDPDNGDLVPIVDANGDLVRPSISDNLARLVGLQIGANKKAGDWSLFVDYRQIGISSIDPNLNDNIFALGNLNVQGFKFGGAYTSPTS